MGKIGYYGTIDYIDSLLDSAIRLYKAGVVENVNVYCATTQRTNIDMMLNADLQFVGGVI